MHFIMRNSLSYIQFNQFIVLILLLLPLLKVTFVSQLAPVIIVYRTRMTEMFADTFVTVDTYIVPRSICLSGKVQIILLLVASN
jgi:hypothetical protein